MNNISRMPADLGQPSSNNAKEETTQNSKPVTSLNPATTNDSDFCVNNSLGIRLPYDKNKWTCKSHEAKNENDIAELTLTKDKIVVTFSNGDRGESCLSCESKTNIVSNDFVTLNKHFNSTEGNIITYFGSLVPSINGWVVVSRAIGMENVYGNDFTANELKEIYTVLSPTPGKN